MAPLFLSTPLSRVAAPDDPDLETMVAAAAAGDERAWQGLWRQVSPWLARLIARPSFLGRLGTREDERLDIVVETMARLRADRFARLGRYLEARSASPGLHFRAWLRVVVKRVGVDYLRAHPDYVDQRREAGPGEAPGRWIDPATLPPPSELPGVRPPVTDHGTALEVARAADDIPAPQRRALERWALGDDHRAIAAALGLAGPADADRLVRAGLERLRRRFRGGAS